MAGRPFPLLGLRPGAPGHRLAVSVGHPYRPLACKASAAALV